MCEKLDAVARPEQILVRDPERGCDVEATWTRCQTTDQIACGVGLCGSAPDDCIHHRYQIPLFVRPGLPLVCHCVIRVAHRHYHESRLNIACALNFHPSGPRPPLPNSRQNGITLAQTALKFLHAILVASVPPCPLLGATAAVARETVAGTPRAPNLSK